MFEIESKNPDEIVFTTKKGSIKINSAEGIIDANLPVDELIKGGLKNLSGKV